MLGKIKTLFKVFIVSIVIIVVLFGLYRREYLSQAIPVYVQYLEQRAKWESLNTGTYVYLIGMGRAYYLFVENSKLVKVEIHGNAFKLEYLLGGEDIKWFLSHNWSLREKKYLIDARFDTIKYILWEKLLRRILFWKSTDRYTYKIGYDFQYAYPRVLIIERDNNKDNYGIGTPYPYTQFAISELVMLPKDEKFTNQVLKDILKKYKASDFKRQHSDIVEDVKMLDEVGGDMIKSAIFKIEGKGR